MLTPLRVQTRSSSVCSCARPIGPRSRARRWNSLRSKPSPARRRASSRAVEPHALPDLVADRLAGPAEVAVDLAAHEVLALAAVLDRERQRQLGRPPLAAVVRLVGRDLQFEVQPDVDDHPHRPHRLRGEHAHLVIGLVEVAELAHEPFRIQGPAFGVARRPRERALVAAERARQVAHLRDLEVMAGDSLVVAGRDLVPEREARLAQRRVPGAAGAAEILGRPRVVHRRRAAGRRDHRLDLLHRVGDVEVHPVELGHGAVEQGLQPRPELVDALDGALRVGVEQLDHRADRLTREDALAHGPHRVLDAAQLVPAPLVRLARLDRHAVEHAGEQDVALLADGVALDRVLRVLLVEEAGERRVGGGGAAGAFDQGVAEHRPVETRPVEPFHQALEERRVAAGPCPRLRLAHALDRLASRGDETLARALGERLLVARQRLRHERRAGRDRPPVVFGVGRHHVEHHADALGGARDHVELAQVLARVVELDGRLEVAPHDVGGDAVELAADRRPLERAQRAAGMLHPLLRRVGRVVGDPVVVAGDALEGRRDRIERGEALDESVGDVVDLGIGRTRLGHGSAAPRFSMNTIFSYACTALTCSSA